MTRLANLCVISSVLALSFAGSAGAQAPTLSDFVLFGSNTLRARGLVVDSGDVGTNGTLVGSKAIDAPDSAIVGDRVELDKKSVCDALRSNGGEASSQCGPATPVAIPVVANLASACGFPSSLPTACSGPDLLLDHDATKNATPGTYNVVDVAGGGRGPATLILSAGTYTFCSLRLGRNAALLASGPVTINVLSSVKLDNGSQVRPDSGTLSACDIKIFANTDGKVRISRKAYVQGTLCAPNAKLDVTQGANLRGAFYARDVKTDRVFLDLQVCVAPTTTSTTTTPTTTSTTSTTATTTTTVAQPTTSSSTAAPSTSSTTSTSTSLEATTSTASTSTSTTSTTFQCGNGVIEPGEQCDGSADSVFCTPEQCVACQCPSTTSITQEPTTTSTSSTAPTSSSTSTSGTVPSTTSSSSSTTTTSTTSSSSTSTILATTSSTSTTVAPTTLPTTSTTSTSTSTSTTSTTGGSTGFDFLSTAGSGSCGNTFRDEAGTVPLKNLLCGSLSLGGGISQVPDNATPSGATNRFALSGCVGTSCNIGPTAAGTTPVGIDCTGPGCRFGTPLPISNAGLSVCVTNTFFPSSKCLDAGKPFACCTGAGTGTCSGPSGTLDTATGAASWTFQLNSATVLTGSPAQPCPICAQAVGGAACSGSVASPCTGVCDGSPNQGAVCTSKNPNGLSNDCPAPAAVAGAGGQRCFRGTNNGAPCNIGSDCPGGLCSQFIGNIPINLSPLTTGTATLSAANGIFCPAQDQTATQKGAYRSDICQTGANSGKPCQANTMGQDPTNCGAGVNCRLGTLTNYCNGGANDGLGCSGAANCPAPGLCVKAGTLAQLVKEVGTPAGALTVGVATPIKLGSVFCVAATTNPTVNSNANLPASGATSVTGSVTLLSN